MKATRIEGFFKPAGSDKIEPLGRLDKIQVTDTITVNGETFTNTYDPADPDSMRDATNRLARAVAGKS